MSSMDDYERGDAIGSGGFADVLRATRISTGRHVALKISRQDSESRLRIRREIEVQSKLAHATVMPARLQMYS